MKQNFKEEDQRNCLKNQKTLCFLHYSTKRKASLRYQELLIYCGKTVGQQVVHQFQGCQGLSAWHEIAEPWKSDLSLRIAYGFMIFLRNGLKTTSYLNVNDEFFVYVSRTLNSQNGRVWTTTDEVCLQNTKFTEWSGMDNSS